MQVIRCQAVTIPYDPTGSCEALNSTLCTASGIPAGCTDRCQRASLFLSHRFSSNDLRQRHASTGSTHSVCGCAARCAFVVSPWIDASAAKGSHRLPFRTAQISALQAIGFNACALILIDYSCLSAFAPCYEFDTQSAAGTILAVYGWMCACVCCVHTTVGIVALRSAPCYDSCVNNVVAICTPVFATLGRPVPPWYIMLSILFS